MIMSWIFTLFLGVSLIFALIFGRGSALAAAVTQGSQTALELALGIGGSICLWTGVGNLMEHIGITAMLGRLLRPILERIFPECRESEAARGAISANICANLLGLGNAATPMGIRAATLLKSPRNPQTATHSLCRLVVLNTASIQLIPANVAAIRASLGASQPFDILLPVWITSFCSAGLGLGMAVLLGRIRKDA